MTWAARPFGGAGAASTNPDNLAVLLTLVLSAITGRLAGRLGPWAMIAAGPYVLVDAGPDTA
ncbi:hypothetical protein GCM10010973_02170 [Cribrihabitans marinus]|nr:hypothetical protein GCM10010973_02170 [Cribrihabitans marinus]